MRPGGYEGTGGTMNEHHTRNADRRFEMRRDLLAIQSLTKQMISRVYRLSPDCSEAVADKLQRAIHSIRISLEQADNIGR